MIVSQFNGMMPRKSTSKRHLWSWPRPATAMFFAFLLPCDRVPYESVNRLDAPPNSQCLYIYICIYIYTHTHIHIYIYVNMDGRGYNIKTNCFQLLGVSKTELYTNRIGDIMRYITGI